MGINRRRFLKSTGYAAAGAALGAPHVGCGSILIPAAECAVPATVTRVPGMRYVVASEIGCALDCDLTTGLRKPSGTAASGTAASGTAATDDAPRIAAALASASATSPLTLILDGSALISGLFLPADGYWGIEGQGCAAGFFVKPGTNNDGIHNGGPAAAQPSDPGPPVPARGSSVTLRNFSLNGNRGDGHTGDSTTGQPQGGANSAWLFGINLMNLDNITLDGLTITNTPAYHIRLSNVGNVTITGCSLLSNTGPNTDGVHFDGPANDIQIAKCNFVLGDDAIAMNCPEGYAGDIVRMNVTDCTFSAISMLRLYTKNAGSPSFQIDSITVSKCTGALYRAAVLIGEGVDSAPASVHSLTLADCSFYAPAVLELSANFGTVALTNVTLTPYASADVGFAFARTASFDSGLTYAGSSLSLTNCTIARNADTPVALLILQNGSTIQSLSLNGFGVVDPAGTSYAAAPALLNLQSGRIGQLALAAVSASGITAPVSAGGFASIGSVTGAGVLASGWEFPDTAVADGVPYLSASAHRAEIKVNGAPRPYP